MVATPTARAVICALTVPVLSLVMRQMRVREISTGELRFRAVVTAIVLLTRSAAMAAALSRFLSARARQIAARGNDVKRDVVPGSLTMVVVVETMTVLVIKSASLVFARIPVLLSADKTLTVPLENAALMAFVRPKVVVATVRVRPIAPWIAFATDGMEVVTPCRRALAVTIPFVREPVTSRMGEPSDVVSIALPMLSVLRHVSAFQSPVVCQKGNVKATPIAQVVERAMGDNVRGVTERAVAKRIVLPASSATRKRVSVLAVTVAVADCHRAWACLSATITPIVPQTSNACS